MDEYRSGEPVKRNVDDVGRNRRGQDPDIDEDLPVDPDAEVVLPAGPGHLRSEFDVLFAIAVGGFLGTLSRYELSAHWVQRADAFPTSIFVINVSGSFAIGLILTVITEILRPTRIPRPLICVGFIGGWTTMSTLAVAGDNLMSSGHVATAIAYLTATVVATPLASAIGISVAHHTRPRSSSRRETELT